MPYDPALATVEANEIITQVNQTFGTELRFITAEDIADAVTDPGGTTTSLIGQINDAPDDEVAGIVDEVTSDPDRLQAFYNLIQDQIENSPNLQAAFDDASAAISGTEFLRLVTPLAENLTIPLPSGGTVFSAVAEAVDFLGIKF